MEAVRLFLTVVFLFLFCGCQTPTHEEFKQTAEQQWNAMRSRVSHQTAQQQYDRALFTDAAKTAKEAIALNPTHTDSYVLLAKAELELSKLASAQRTLEDARKLGLNSPDLLYLNGVILEHQDNVEPALESYTQARALDDSKVDYLMAQVECLVTLNRFEEALSLLRENVGVFDDDAALSYLAARVCLCLNRPDEAISWLSRALLSGAESPALQEQLGMLLQQCGRCKEAIETLSPLVESMKGEYGGIRRSLAACHLSVGDYLTAQRLLEDYAVSNPDDAPAQILLAKAAIGCNDLRLAARAVALAEQKAPLRTETLLVRGVLEWKRGNVVQAEAALRKLLLDNPTDEEANCLLGEILLAAGQHEKSRQHFDRALQTNPTCTWAQSSLRSFAAVP